MSDGVDARWSYAAEKGKNAERSTIVRRATFLNFIPPSVTSKYFENTKRSSEQRPSAYRAVISQVGTMDTCGRPNNWSHTYSKQCQLEREVQGKSDDDDLHRHAIMSRGILTS